MGNFEKWQSRYSKWHRCPKGRKKWVFKIEKEQKENEKKEQQRRKRGEETKEEELRGIVALINIKRAISPDQYDIGDERESRFEKTLEFLMEKKRILGYEQSRKLTRSDIKRGIDFYVIVMNGSRREVYCVDITGPDWVESGELPKNENVDVTGPDWVESGELPKNEKKKIIGIESDEPMESIIKKIEKEIPLLLVSKDS